MILGGLLKLASGTARPTSVFCSRAVPDDLRLEESLALCDIQPLYKMNLLKSSDATIGPSFSRTNLPLTCTDLFARSGPSKLTSSTTRSRIVCSRRAPMFCVVRLTSKAMSASASMPSGVNFRVHAFGFKQFGVLLGQGVLRLGQDAQEILVLQIGQLDADREAALQFRHQVGRLRQVERPGGDEQDVIGPHRAVRC